MTKKAIKYYRVCNIFRASLWLARLHCFVNSDRIPFNPNSAGLLNVPTPSRSPQNTEKTKNEKSKDVGPPDPVFMENSQSSEKKSGHIVALAPLGLRYCDF